MISFPPRLSSQDDAQTASTRGHSGPPVIRCRFRVSDRAVPRHGATPRPSQGMHGRVAPVHRPRSANSPDCSAVRGCPARDSREHRARGQVLRSVVRDGKEYPRAGVPVHQGQSRVREVATLFIPRLRPGGGVDLTIPARLSAECVVCVRPARP